MFDEFEDIEQTLSEDDTVNRPTLTPEEELVQRHYGQLPVSIQKELAAFVANYDYCCVRWNEFAVNFNRLLTRQLVSLMLGGDPNSRFFDIPTQSHEVKDFWDACYQMAINMYPGIQLENLPISDFSKISRKVTMDGFEFSHYVNLWLKENN